MTAVAMFKQQNAPGDNRRAIHARGVSVSGDRSDNLQDHLQAPRYAAKCTAVRKFFLMFELVAAVRLCRQSRMSSPQSLAHTLCSRHVSGAGL